MIWLPGVLSQGGKKYIWERYSVVRKEIFSENETVVHKSSEIITWSPRYTVTDGELYLGNAYGSYPSTLSPGDYYTTASGKGPHDVIYEVVSSTQIGNDYQVVRKAHRMQDVIGIYIDTVEATSADAYPENGVQGDYWYVLVESGSGSDPSVNYVGYIQSSGTQFIDSNFKPNQNTRVVMDVELTTSTSSSNQWLFCGRTALQKAAFGFFHNQQNFGATYGTDQDMAILSSDGLDRITIDFNKNVLTFTGGSKTFSAQTFTSGGTLCLLTRNTNGTKDCYASAKLYSCKIYDNEVLIRDYRPCLDPDGVACMYDKVNTEYVYNAGSGTFAYGVAA